jgi:alpha-galactosidase
MINDPAHPKIAIVGAGGYVFPLLLIRDILGFEALQASTFALFDIDLPRAEYTLHGAQALIDAHGLAATAFATDERKRALDGADVVICAFQVGGLDAYRCDVEIPREYGIDQPVGDTLGPGGVFRGLRSIGALREIAADMRALCPGALLIQYANPMSMNCWATERLGIPTVGLCHSVQHTSRMLAEQIDVPYEEVTYDSAGVNHTAWFTTFRRGSEDLLPVLRRTMAQRHIVDLASVGEATDLHANGSEKVRSSLMELTGYFHTESSTHASEYWAWFRKNPELVADHLPSRWDYFEICSNHSPDRNDEIIEATTRDGLKPSEEFGAYIIDSMATGTRRVIYGNVPNRGTIPNLADDCCVEVACLVDAMGVRPVRHAGLPLACAALNTVQINVQRLAVEAALTGDRSLVHAAIALDPLSGALLSLPQLREMVDRMFVAEAAWLPHFA